MSTGLVVLTSVLLNQHTLLIRPVATNLCRLLISGFKKVVKALKLKPLFFKALLIMKADLHALALAYLEIGGSTLRHFFAQTRFLRHIFGTWKLKRICQHPPTRLDQGPFWSLLGDTWGVMNGSRGVLVPSSKLAWKLKGTSRKNTILYVGSSMSVHINLEQGIWRLVALLFDIVMCLDP